MKLIKRIVADIRGPGMTDHEADMMVNESLIELQTNQEGKLNPNIEILDISEVTKDSGIMVFIVLYNDKGLDK
jgi:threonine aldolase